MKRLIAWTLAALLLGAGAAHAGSISAGVFGGMSVPVLQEDQENGSMFGLRARANLVPLFAVEPFYASTALGDGSVDVGGLSFAREGFDVTTFGVNAMLTMGGPVSFYPFVGIGSAKYKRTGQEDSFTSYHMGLGIGLSPMPKFSVDLRGELQAAVDGDVSRKTANITLGASYSIFSMP